MAWFKRDADKLGETPLPEERTVKTEGIFVKCENEDCGVTDLPQRPQANLKRLPYLQLSLSADSARAFANAL
jgi:hypothetical protein